MKAYILLGLFMFGCLMQITQIDDIDDNPDKYAGESVTVKGIVQDSIKLGELSGFTLSDGTGSIRVKSDTLPPEGEEVTVTGTVVQDSIFGHYILAKDVKWSK